ncbi:Zinc finger MYM-type protein 1 [Linum grandiflorum]
MDVNNDSSIRRVSNKSDVDNSQNKDELHIPNPVVPKKVKQSRLDAIWTRNVVPKIVGSFGEHVQQTEKSLADEPNISINASCDDASCSSIERDPGIRKSIMTYPPGKRDEIRRAYLTAGPYQIRLSQFPKTGPPGHLRCFQQSWYDEFPWLEYSLKKDAAYCLYCYLFAENSDVHHGWEAFTSKDFQSWKRVKSGAACSFRKHIGEGPNSEHNKAVKMADTLMHQAQHIDKVIGKQTSEEVKKNIIRVKASISVAKLLSRQGIPFRGHDESIDSSNRGNFLEIPQHTGDQNEKIASVILENAPKNAKYTSGAIQKEIVHVLAGLVRKKIFEEIGDAKFSIIVDEASDESRKEQMAIVLRFVDGKGLIQERFFAIVHVKDTMSMTLCSAIRDTLSSHNFSLQNLRGQGYDGASNMHGEWKGLQALFLKKFPHAYYVHRMAHHLQLALVAASREN